MNPHFYAHDKIQPVKGRMQTIPNWKESTWERKRRAARKMLQDVRKYLRRKGI